MGCGGSKEKEEAPAKAAPAKAAPKKSGGAAPIDESCPKTAVNPLKNALAAVKGDDEPNASKVTEQHLSSDHSSRLNVKVKNKVEATSKLEEKEKNQSEAGKLFDTTAKGPERSKIWQALNPTQLAYKSRREQEEEAGEKWTVEIRGGGKSGSHGVAQYQKMTDEDGNLVDVLEDSEEEEEEVDHKNLPNFGEFQAEMDAKRAERAEKLEKKQMSLKRAYTAKKEAEQAEIDKELAKIAAREAAQKKIKDEEEAKLIKEAHSRLSDPNQFKFDFSFSG
jgi:hypothetical protein